MENKDRKGRKQLIGKVVSDKGDKTISVLVETYKKHPLYNKRVKHSKKYAAHDEQNMAEMGDKVRIEETRPLSSTKHFRLVEIIEKAIKI
ncbi:30S ribosomal protein S17 [Mycoplasmatota bacterium]|nr:30S ribosomal protein S17 [Mycoplasmatota bacterium]